MNFSEFYGKYWNYTPRQWRNVGLVFEGNTTGINKDFMLEALKENGDRLGYVLYFIQIMILKREIANNNRYISSGIRPELIYDKWTIKSTKIQQYIRDESGNIKPNVLKRPYTHVLNCYNKWLKQLMSDVHKLIGRYDHRINSIDEVTTYLEPEVINNWIDKYSEDWISEWVYEPDTEIDEDDDDK